MVNKIYRKDVAPGRNGTKDDAPEHDCLTWFSPPGHLEGPNRSTSRCLRTVMTKAVSKTSASLPPDVIDKASIRAALQKGLRMKVNRRRNSARVLGCRALGVYLDPSVPQSTIQSVVVESASAVDDEDGPASVGGHQRRHQLVLDSGGTNTVRLLSMDDTAASLLGEFLGIDACDVSKSARTAGAATVKAYVEQGELRKFIRPESDDVRGAIVKTLQDELSDAAAGDINLSDEDLDD